MTVLNLWNQNLVRLEVEGGSLIAYFEDSDSRTYSWIGVTSFICSNNQLTSLPAILPKSLRELFCFSNRLISLPPLPEGLEILHCSNNHLTSLPLLPDSLKHLGCADNKLTSLPLLPKNMRMLDCSENNLEILSPLPERLELLECSKNNLSVLPSLPEELEELHCQYNSLKYIPFLKKRPQVLNVPDHLLERYSVWNYQEGYQIQEIYRYLFLTIFCELGFQLDFLI